MGHKKLCINCKLTNNLESDYTKRLQKYHCPICNDEMILLPHRFRPPKKSDKEKWKVVEYLLQQGFRYQHTFMDVPENLREAKEFWKAFQARKKGLDSI